MKLAFCLRRPCISGAELGERANGREAQGTPRRGASLRGAFLLGTFLWQGKEKYLAQRGRKEGEIVRSLSESGDCCFATLAMMPTQGITQQTVSDTWGRYIRK